MKKFISLMMFCAALSLSSVAYAQLQMQSGTHVGLAGLATSNLEPYGLPTGSKVIYVGIAENPSACLYGGVVFSNVSDHSKVLAVALAAKALGKTVRIDFEQPGGSGTTCHGKAIYLE